MTGTKTRTWDGLILEARTEFGAAARRNRGRFSGAKVHRLRSEYIIGLVEGVEPRPGTMGARFKRFGRPVLFSCRPACGCTDGQMAGSPAEGLAADAVTCTKCLAK